MTDLDSGKAVLRHIDGDVAANLIVGVADVALVLDGDGTIQGLHVGADNRMPERFGAWVGQPWIETVTIESRPKIREILTDVTSGAPLRARQINHVIEAGESFPVRYWATKGRNNGPIIAIGRDLQPLADLQQRLVSVQQNLERDYARLRHAETRYRALFQIVSEPIVIIDAATQRIVEANPAAAQILGLTGTRPVGRPLAPLIDGGNAIFDDVYAKARTLGRAEDVPVRLSKDGRAFLISASLFRQDQNAHFLVRFAPVESGEPPSARAKSRVLLAIDRLPDGFVVTDLETRVLDVNPAFLDLAQLATREQAQGELLERWLGRPGIDLSVLTANLREHGSVRSFATVLRGEYGSNEDVEVSAVGVPGPETGCYGFVVRTTGRPPAGLGAGTPPPGLPHSVDHLTRLVGRVALKDLVRETTDVIERLCIEAALEITNNNRASAAEMLGLSRQSLYAKLHRFGIGDLSSEPTG